ncbi:MAG: hypothetical protein IPN91_14100 [Holophagaceae bacterium]|uniref:Uncharacterized protein n=1 Tax=Candidatus Geothrix odensensis TaxID=2954440 RepID=A0A936F4P3_9BACT|nr:hypothetical protein [Candidatus Geothrix odensensis]
MDPQGAPPAAARAGWRWYLKGIPGFAVIRKGGTATVIRCCAAWSDRG